MPFPYYLIWSIHNFFGHPNFLHKFYQWYKDTIAVQKRRNNSWVSTIIFMSFDTTLNIVPWFLNATIKYGLISSPLCQNHECAIFLFFMKHFLIQFWTKILCQNQWSTLLYYDAEVESVIPFRDGASTHASRLLVNIFACSYCTSFFSIIYFFDSLHP